MYRTCLYCNRDMGTNEVLETLPVGRRIAFDSAQGRLWVVCRGCEKWNLVPFDTRLETIEACERLFRGTRMRFSTDNIGIARLSEGLELVRVGAAQRPEFASWRYGDQFGRRRKRAAMYGVAGVFGIVGFYYVGSTIGLSMALMPSLYNGIRGAYHRRLIAARLPMRNGIGGAVSRSDLKDATLVYDRHHDWGLELALYPGARGRTLVGTSSNERRTVNLWGAQAVEALGRVLPAVNTKGGSAATVQSAVIMVETTPIQDLLGRAGAWARIARKNDYQKNPKLTDVDPTIRLALEMAAHEDTEREALAGELKLLERQWREAERLAAISDSLALPESSDVELGQLKGEEG